MITPKTALFFVGLALILGLGLYVMYPTPQKYETPQEQPKDNPPEETNNIPPGTVMEDGTDNNATTTAPEQVFCTMEAKLCPDGSYVGRQGPKCEFAPCPK